MIWSACADASSRHSLMVAHYAMAHDVQTQKAINSSGPSVSLSVSQCTVTCQSQSQHKCVRVNHQLGAQLSLGIGSCL